MGLTTIKNHIDLTFFVHPAGLFRSSEGMPLAESLLPACLVFDKSERAGRQVGRTRDQLTIFESVHPAGLEPATC